MLKTTKSFTLEYFSSKGKSPRAIWKIVPITVVSLCLISTLVLFFSIQPIKFNKNTFEQLKELSEQN
ncbi:hypothetical protein Y032_0709g1723 [Ancylostoma ceylanicum]|nr:hypothetical protein Y032_0709g1723 [Ancylostoma ceylanicum]